MWVFEWTNDQFHPAIKDASVVYRKLHAYAFIAQFLSNKDVLEVASLDVSGTGILAREAASVVSLVASPNLSERAADRYRLTNLQFLPQRPGELAGTYDHHFDAIVALDGSGSDEDYLPTLKRLLKPEGVLVVSVFEKKSLQNLLQWLGPHFRSIEVLGQGTYAGSAIWPLAEPRSTTPTVLMSRDKKGDLQVARGNPQESSSLIAVASDGAPLTRETGSILIDAANEILEDREKSIRDLTEDGASRGRMLEQCEQQLAERRETLASLQEGFAWQKTQIAALAETRDFLEREVAHYRNAQASNEDALRWRAALVEELEARAVKLQEAIDWYHGNLERTKEELRTTIAERQTALEKLSNTSDELQSIKTSAGWGMILRVRSVRDRLMPPGGAAHRLYQRFMSSSKLRGGR